MSLRGSPRVATLGFQGSRFRVYRVWGPYKTTLFAVPSYDLLTNTLVKVGYLGLKALPSGSVKLKRVDIVKNRLIT